MAVFAGGRLAEALLAKGNIMNISELTDFVTEALDDNKAKDVTVLDVHELTTITDVMIICTGTSTRHVKAIAKNLVEQVKNHAMRPTSIEGENQGEWVLIDLSDIIVHIMLQPVREFYDLERLWSVPIEADNED